MKCTFVRLASLFLRDLFYSHFKIKSIAYIKVIESDKWAKLR